MAIDRSFFSVTAQGVDALAGAAGADIFRGADRKAVKTFIQYNAN